LVAVENTNDIKSLKNLINEHLQIHSSVIQILKVAALPLTDRGKKDYYAIQGLAGLKAG
jgi:hypothetical protein